MKKCDFCQMDMQDGAFVCSSCGHKKDRQPISAWYFNGASFVGAFLIVGPFALPLVWFNPRLNNTMKILITGAVFALSYVLFVVCAHALKIISSYYGMMQQGLQ